MGPLPYVAMQSLLDPLWGPGAHNYFKAGWLRGLDDGAIDTLVDYHHDVSSPKTEIHVHHMGGAVARVPAGATAFGDRSAPFLLNIIASTFTADGYDDAVRWAQACTAAMEPVPDRRHVRQLHLGRGAGPRARRLRRRHVRPPARAQGRVRPDQPVPPQPERQAVEPAPMPMLFP